MNNNLGLLKSLFGENYPKDEHALFDLLEQDEELFNQYIDGLIILATHNPSETKLHDFFEDGRNRLLKTLEK